MHIHMHIHIHIHIYLGYLKEQIKEGTMLVIYHHFLPSRATGCTGKTQQTLDVEDVHGPLHT